VSDIQTRKAEHLRLAMEIGSQYGGLEPFSDVSLPCTALPEINLAEVDTTTILLKKKLSQPLIIASMTGGLEQGLQIAMFGCGMKKW